jgi:DNA-binding beta-propeller fold protein YncE
MKRVCALLACSAALIAASGYHAIGTIPVRGEGGWDYLTADESTGRVYVSHAAEVDVLDTTTHAPRGKITGLKGVHGIAIAPDLGRGYISNGQGNSVTVFDLKTLGRVGEDIPAGKNPDAIIYDSASKRIFAFNGGDKSVTVINSLGVVDATIALDGKPEFAASNGENAVFVNLEDKSMLVRIDSRKLLVEQQWPLAPCESPSSMAIDRKTGRLFIGCHNKMMAVVDAKNGKVITTVPIGAGVDATSFDPGTGLIFSSCGDGTLTVVHEDSADKYTVDETVTTPPGSRTSVVDPKTHKVFISTAEFEPAQPAEPGQQRPRRKIVPGSFSVLVYGQ